MDKILNHIEKIDSDVKRMTKKGFWRKIFSGKKIKFLRPEVLLLPTFTLMVLPILLTSVLGFFGYESTALEVGVLVWSIVVLSLGITTLTMREKYLSPGDDCGVVSSSLSDLRDILQDGKIDDLDLKKIINNMPYLSIEWWREMRETLNQYKNNQNGKCNKTKIDLIKREIMSDENLLIKINLKEKIKNE